MTLFLVLMISLLAGCDLSKANQAESTEPGKTMNTDKQVARIVFVGKKNACDCTRKRIQTSWTALRAVLGNPPSIPVERIQLDVDKKRAESLSRTKKFMVVPGMYFLAKTGALVELLQGELAEKQILKVLDSNRES